MMADLLVCVKGCSIVKGTGFFLDAANKLVMSFITVTGIMENGVTTCCSCELDTYFLPASYFLGLVF